MNPAQAFYDVPTFGNVSLLHFTDCRGQLLPIYYREPSINLGGGMALGRILHLVDEALLQALTSTRAAVNLMPLPTLISSRLPALLLDGGGSWGFGDSTVDRRTGHGRRLARTRRRFDIMTGHWEFTHGAARVQHVAENDFKDKFAFVAQIIVHVDICDGVRAVRDARTEWNSDSNHRSGVSAHTVGEWSVVHPRLKLRHRRGAPAGRRRCGA